MAHGAGVRDAQLQAHLRVRGVERVVASRVAGHVGALRHVALHAARAHGAGGAGAVRGGINDGGGLAVHGRAVGVAAQAEAVVLLRQFQLGRVRVVAVQAGDPCRAHFAEAQACLAVVFVLLHAVGVENTGECRQLQAEVLIEAVAHGKVAVHLLAPCVAGGTVIVVLRCTQLAVCLGHEAAVLGGGVGGFVALQAGDPRLFPSGGKAVAFLVVVLAKAGHVAPSALGVPVHASAQPVPPLPGLAPRVAFLRQPRVVLEHIEPLAPQGIPGRTGGVQAAVLALHQILHQGRATQHGVYIKHPAALAVCYLKSAVPRGAEGDPGAVRLLLLAVEGLPVQLRARLAPSPGMVAAGPGTELLGVAGRALQRAGHTLRVPVVARPAVRHNLLLFLPAGSKQQRSKQPGGRFYLHARYSTTARPAWQESMTLRQK